jgi:type IX secretion system PorP/SprF family membrane protein
MGLQFSYVNQFYDMSKLVYNDQLYTGAAVSNDAVGFQNIGYVAIHAGALYTSPVSWVGVAIHNLGKANTSFMDGNNPLPVKYAFHGGYKFIIEKKGNSLKKYIAAAANFRGQQKFNQMDIGTYYFVAPICLGVWYRGIPMEHYKPKYPNSDAVFFLVGLEIKDLRIGLSYDLTISRLAAPSNGASEISVQYEIAKKSRRRKVYVSCPKF